MTQKRDSKELYKEMNVLFLDSLKLDCPDFIYKGGFGITHSGKYHDSIKVLSKRMIKTNVSQENFRKELFNLKYIRHEHIPRFYGVSNEKDEMILVSQLVEGTTLSSHLKKTSLDDIQKMLMVLELAKVLEYLHGNLIIHKDLKPENVMIDKNSNLYLIDFGISKKTKANATMSELEGSILYMAPESFDLVDNYQSSIDINKQFFKVTTKFDVWSFGCLVDEVFSGNRPWLNSDTKTVQFNLTIKREYQFQRNDNIIKYNEFINSCCENDLNLRFDMEQCRTMMMKIFFRTLKKLINTSNGSVEDFMKLPFISNLESDKISNYIVLTLRILKSSQNTGNTRELLIIL